MGQLHGLNDSINDHRRTQTCSKPQKKHTSPVIISQCLHGCVIDYFDRTIKGFHKIKTYPATAQIVWLIDDVIMHYRPWITDGYYVYPPVSSMFFDSRYHF